MYKITVENQDAKGIAIGEAFLVSKKPDEADSRTISDSEKEEQQNRFLLGLEEAIKELREISASDPIFAAHLEIAQDETLSGLVISKINSENKSAEWSLREAGDEICSLMEQVEDSYLKERVTDIRDVICRIMKRLKGESTHPFKGISKEVIIVADELFPSDTVQMDFDKVRGLVTRYGGATSHVCIIARNHGIPAFTGLGDDIGKMQENDQIILDGAAGEIIVNPDETTLSAFREKMEIIRRQESLFLKLKELETITPDGCHIDLMGNVSGANEVEDALDKGASGIGLFRSEFLYLKSRQNFPDEETQFAEYKKAAEACGSKPLIIRTLDIGGDKQLPYFKPEHEENPFLGWRAIRVSLEMTEVFRIQIRALLRASHFGNIKILFPMIISMEEWREAKSWVERCKLELRGKGIAFNEQVALGVMIETPAAVMIACDLATEADFFSIGTNDLTQYILAVDRLNPKVARLYNPFHPAVIRCIRQIIRAADKYGKPVGMCGELAGNPNALKLLLGLGLKEFSVAPSRIPEIKSLIRNIPLGKARDWAHQVCGLKTIQEIETALKMHE